MARSRRRHRFELNADINVVSLIDVMLLLLVIFMITAPMMQGGVDITLPRATARPLESKGSLGVTINAAGVITVDDQKMPLSEFRLSFKTIAMNRMKEGVYVRADRHVPYEIVVQVISIMKAAGVEQIGLVTEPEDVR